MMTASHARAAPAGAVVRRPVGGALRRTARLALAGAALLAAAGGASADEGGLGGFLASIFGGHAQQAAPAPQVFLPPRAYAPRYGAVRYDRDPIYRRSRARPLTVRLRASKPRLVVAQGPVKPGKVSIYEDRTLRRGDAVMTADGVRVFAGSTSWPYAAGDFVALKDARIDRDASRVLAQLDRLPRG